MRYGSVIFPDFEIGIKFMEEVGMSGIRPASVRLMDNVQFKFGMALKPKENSITKRMIDAIKKYYVLNIKGFDQD
jgi:alkyldihydroxyacetonephosphate synthase